MLVCFATSRETASAVAPVRLQRECRVRVGGHSSHVVPRPCAERERSFAGELPLYGAWAHMTSAARCARGKLACVATSRETSSAVALVRVPREGRVRVLEVTAGTSHHCLTLRIRGLSPVQGLSMIRVTITTSVARRTRAASLRVTPPPKRQPAQWRLFACNANAGCVLEATARTSHHGLAPKDRGLPLAKCQFMAHRPNEPSAARCVRGKLACVATP